MATNSSVSIAGRKDKSSPMKKAPVAKVKVSKDTTEEENSMATTTKKKKTTGVIASAPTGATKEKIKAEKQAAKPAGKATAKTTVIASAPKTQAKSAAPAKAEEKKPVKQAPKTAQQTSSTKTLYHVSKRDNDGREWKVFIQGSNKVIKLFPTQQQALDYAKQLCDNKNDGSMVYLHGLDGKIRKY